MNTSKTLAALVAAATLNAFAAPGQVSTQELYSVKFRATCTPSEDGNGRSSKMTERDFIEQCVGTGFSQKELKRNYALVYNPSADRLQVASRNDGSILCDALIFEGGTNAVAGDQLTRFVFVFGPDQAEAIGSAVITERASGNSDRRARISGRLQFTRTVHTGANTQETATAITEATLPSPESGDVATNTNNPDPRNLTSSSDTNSNDGLPVATGTQTENNNGSSGAFVQSAAASVAAVAGEVEICTGTFVAGKRFEIGTRSGGNDDDDDGDPTAGDGGQVNDGNSSTNGVGSTNAPNSIDTRFVAQAIQNNRFEIDLANLALQNSTNEQVLAYAQRLIQDHTAANHQLLQLAGEKGITVPTTTSQANQNALDRLSDLSGRQFDRQFASQSIASHRSAISVFENESSRGGDADLRSHADSQLPLLREHLAEALDLEKTL